MHSPLDTRSPFTRAAALAAGIDPTRRTHTRLFPGVYVDREVEVTPLLRVRGALALFEPSAFASHLSAARVHGVPVPSTPTEHVTVVEARHRRRPAGVVPHLNPSPRVVVVGGVRVSSPEQMFVELAALLPLVDLVVAGDDLVRRGKVSLAALVTFCAASRGHGARAARVAASYVRERVDSPMETRLRMLLVLAGSPEPLVNITVTDVHGRPVRRYDLCWPGVRVIVEYDGRHHVEREETWESDIDRREAIDGSGWRIVVVTSRGIYREPARTLERVGRPGRASARGAPETATRGLAPALPEPLTCAVFDSGQDPGPWPLRIEHCARSRRGERFVGQPTFLPQPAMAAATKSPNVRCPDGVRCSRSPR